MARRLAADRADPDLLRIRIVLPLLHYRRCKFMRIFPAKLPNKLRFIGFFGNSVSASTLNPSKVIFRNGDEQHAANPEDWCTVGIELQSGRGTRDQCSKQSFWRCAWSVPHRHARTLSSM